MSAPLWTHDSAAAATGGRALAPFSARGLSIDTRTIAAGDLFVALKGEARDGHAFVAEALEKGAAGALVSMRPAGVPRTAPLLVVDDVMEGLTALARAARGGTRARVAGITGSVGKTSTKEALRTALAAQGPTHAAIASYNNHIGVPLSLAQMPPQAAYGVFEIGMNHSGEILPLTRLTRPHAAIVTTVEPVHLENFDNVEGIADAKGEIFAGLLPGGTAVVFRDNPHYQRLVGHAERSAAGTVWSFGTHAAADARLLDVTLAPHESHVTAALFGETIRYTYGAPGRHLVMNSLGVLLMVKALGADVHEAAAAFAQFQALKGRGQQLSISTEAGPFRVIDESYNANPASMRAAVALAAQIPVGPGGRRIAVLGDMLELGPEEAAFHAGLAAPLAEAGIDLVFCCGPLMAHLWAALPAGQRGAFGQTSADLAPLVAAEARAGDVIVVKGSFSSRMRAVVEALAARQAGQGG